MKTAIKKKQSGACEYNQTNKGGYKGELAVTDKKDYTDWESKV